MTQLVKNLPAVWETWVQSLGWDDPVKKGKATHSDILAWRIPWSRKKLDMTEKLLDDGTAYKMMAHNTTLCICPN